MQEEVTQKTIALSMKTGKLTAQVLQAALKKYLQHRAKGKNTLHHGQQSLKQLKKHGADLSNIEITEANIGAFKPCAKKYGVDFTLWLAFMGWISAKNCGGLLPALGSATGGQSHKRKILPQYRASRVDYKGLCGLTIQP